ncbi:YciI family protein [Pseudochelatococcus lubricantis]|uniref:YciI family protein n=1 Tax=Pseudochelatococcus lubricantis TaxID=1538102 RepID=UPI0035E780B4
MSHAIDDDERLVSMMLQKTFFVMLRTTADAARIAPAMHDHHRWIIALEKEGRIFASGPLSGRGGEPAGGMTVFRAASHEDAEAMAGGDPLVTSGGVTFEIKRWTVNEGRLILSVDFSDRSFALD